jgi:Ca2+-binding RTX toxin-like protein
MRHRRALRSVLAACITAAAASAAPAASAAVTCVYNPIDHSLSVTADGGFSNGLGVGPDGSICGGATVTNTDTIDITTNGSFFKVRGVFEPGFTPEATGRSEIEIVVRDPFTLILTVPGYATEMAAGTQGVNLNGDDDADVTFGVVPRNLEIQRQRNPKPPRLVKQPLTMTGNGGLGTGDPYAGFFLWLVGGKGNDHLIASDNGGSFLDARQGDDVLDGGPGTDFLDGGDGNDVLNGGAGDDGLAGNRGDDDVTGGPGHDQINGSSGNDALHAADGEADQVDGGPDTDTADVDAGLDTVKNVP